MEDVLSVYTRPHDPDRPLVCLDETTKQLETRTPVPMQKRQPARLDYEYERNGTANLFMMFARLEGWRHVKVTERRMAIHYANVLKNTHTPASLYEAFPAPEARRLVERLEWHYTPKHGSWLDLAESELGVLATQCLDRRIPDRETLVEAVAAWQCDCNRNHAKADWHFTTENARIKLKHLSPSL
jgi:hypothetical protein